jgi:hypothetical protein
MANAPDNAVITKAWTYDQRANTLAKDLASSRTITPERIGSLSDLVRKASSDIAAKIVGSPLPRTGR